MEVNGSGGRLDRKTSKEKSVKKTSPTEKNIAGSVRNRQKEKGTMPKRETGQTTCKEV